MTSLAWAGELELQEAKWTDRDGHTVKFKLVTPNEERPNPFKAFTKRRKGRAGTRFIASCSHVQGARTEGTVCYNGEFMLAGWADTSTTGYSVTFWCEAPDTGMHAFESYVRGRDTFMVALVELGEDDVPVNQAARSRVEAAVNPKNDDQISDSKANPAHDNGRPGRRLSNYAAMLCDNPHFWEWINAKINTPTEPGYDWVNSREGAARWMREVLEIESRKELDDGGRAEKQYHELIRKPFVEWQEARGVLA